MKILFVLLMLASAAGMIFGLRKHKEGETWGRPLTIVCLVIAFVLMLVNLRPSGPGTQAIVNREIAYRQALGAKIGQEIAREFPDSHVVVLPDQVEGSPAVEGLKSALRGAGTVEVVVPDFEAHFRDQIARGNLHEEDAEYWFEEALMEMEMSASLFNATVRQAGQAPDVLVLFAPLPHDYARLDILRQADRPRIILASTEDVWMVEGILNRIEQGLFHGIVLFNMGNWRMEGRVPSDVQEAFAERYIWITRDNLQEVMAEHPDLIEML